MAKVKAVAPPEYIARRPMGYVGRWLDWGQIFSLAGAPNDAKLIRLGYVMLFDSKQHDRVTCPDCGADFTGHDAKIEHVRMRHRELTEAQEEEMQERQERKLAEISPLYLENTVASKR